MLFFDDDEYSRLMPGKKDCNCKRKWYKNSETKKG